MINIAYGITHIKDSAIFMLSKCHFLSDIDYIKLKYRLVFGKKIDLTAPETFNEKLQWLKLFDRNENYIFWADKYSVRDYVAKTIGEEHLIPLLGVWDRVSDVDFAKLPNQFVIKCTHDSGSVIVCRDKEKFDIEKAKAKLGQKLNRNMFYWGREWVYKDIKPRIIAEQFMIDEKYKELRDYKFFCFNGKVKCFKIDFDRFVDHKANYYDRDGKLLPFEEVICPSDPSRIIDIPAELGEMITYAERLASNIPFVRVDFYDVAGIIYFGEMTFYPAAGFGVFNPDSADYTLGSWITLPERG